MTERPRANAPPGQARRAGPGAGTGDGSGDGPFAGRTTNSFASRGLAATLSGVLSAAAALAPAQPSHASPQDTDPRGFAIQETRQAAALAQTALEHIAALRHADAIAALQELIVSHKGHVLQPPGGGADGSEHVGASNWARARLFELPEEARKLYATRYSSEAQFALESARRTRGRRELIEIARRYPLTASARDAWRSLGDLELELGHVGDARAAWERAEELDALLGLESGAPAAARSEMATSLASAPDPEPPSVPAADCATWQQSLSRGERLSPFDFTGEHYKMFPVVEGDTVLVSDSLALFAFDAWSGERRWVTAEPPGWDRVDAGDYKPNGEKPVSRKEFFGKQLHMGTWLVRPAASAGVALAALQIPFTRNYNEQFQGFPITSVDLERRLFAFDLATGAPLWNHQPAPAWDGGQAPFPQMMSACAPPVIAGSRVIVPSSRMEGRIDLQLGCYDLFSGELLWSTALISGQLELNMFGRQWHEFCAAPVTVADHRVIVLTQLGAVAALDLFTGDVLWETLYDQIEIPPVDFHQPNPRPQYWANTAPAVAGEVVVVTPVDSHDMLGLDLATGAKLWKKSWNAFSRSNRGLLTLLGADEDRVWLSGLKVMSLRAPRGLASLVGPTEPVESDEVLFTQQPSPRPLLTGRNVIAPTQSRRVVLDRDALRQEDRVASADWTRGQRAGNVATTDGAMYFATFETLLGCVDWTVIEERYRRRCDERPDDPRPALDWASLLERRGQQELDAARIDAALDLFAAGFERLEPFLVHAQDTLRAEVATRAVSLQLAQARALQSRADPIAALARVRRARELAAGGLPATEEGLARSLVAAIELLEVLDREPERALALAELEQRCAGSLMPEDWWERSGSARYQESLPRSPALSRMPVSLYAMIEGALAARTAGDLPRELERLHQILERWSDVVLPPPREASDGELGVSASERIGRIADEVALDERAAAAYAPFETRAAAALDAARASGDAAELERIPRLYPHSQAAREAELARLEAALRVRDTERVVAIVTRSLPGDWSVERSRPDDVQLLLALRVALSDAGNEDLSRALLARLAEHHGETASQLERDGGKTIAELAASAGPPPERPRRLGAETREFSAASSTYLSQRGSYLPLGEFASDDGDDAPPIFVSCLRKDGVELVQAFDPRTPAQPVWTAVLPRDSVRPGSKAERICDTLVFAGRSSVQGLDPVSGEVRWTWRAPASQIERISYGAGAAYVVTTGDARTRLAALDGRSGLELWTRDLPGGLWPVPVVGDRYVALLPSDWGASPVLVLDRLTGTRARTFELPAHAGQDDVQGAWVEGDRLILPSFPKTSSYAVQDCVVSYDLETGERAWGVSSELGQAFDSIVRCGEDAYLIFLHAQRPGTIQQLSTRIGAVRTLQNVSIGPGDVLVGVERHKVVELDGPYLFLRSASADGQSTDFQAIHLPYGRSWTHQVQSQIYSGRMPLPVLTQTSAVLAWTEPPLKSGRPSPARTQFLVLHRENGSLTEQSTLPPELGTADAMQIFASGASLWIVGQQATGIRTKPGATR